MSAVMQAAEFETRRDRLAAAWNQLPDKPEETPEGIARALWLTAAGQPSSVQRALASELPPLSCWNWYSCRPASTTFARWL